MLRGLRGGLLRRGGDRGRTNRRVRAGGLRDESAQAPGLMRRALVLGVLALALAGCAQYPIATVESRLDQEIARLGGRFAHVLDERIETKRDAVTDEAWLHGRFVYMLYR